MMDPHHPQRFVLPEWAPPSRKWRRTGTAGTCYLTAPGIFSIINFYQPQQNFKTACSTKILRNKVCPDITPYII